MAQYTPYPNKEALMITGVTGYVGRCLLARLAQTDSSVLALYRKRHPNLSDCFFPVFSDLSDSELLKAPLRGVKTIIHLAWEGSYQEGGAISPSKGNLVGMENLISSAEKVGVQRFVFVSALGASSRTDSRFLKEKHQAEHLLLNSLIPEKVVLRSPVVFGGERSLDRFASSISRLLKMPLFYPVPGRKKEIPLIHVEDLCSIISGLLHYKLPLPVMVFDLKVGEPYPVSAILSKYAQESSGGARFPLTRLFSFLCAEVLEKYIYSDQQVPRFSCFLSLDAPPAFGEDVTEHLEKLCPGAPRRLL